MLIKVRYRNSVMVLSNLLNVLLINYHLSLRYVYLKLCKEKSILVLCLDNGVLLPFNRSFIDFRCCI